MKTKEEIQESIKETFSDYVQDNIKDGSALDIFSAAIGNEIAGNYDEIEKNRTPHIWSSLKGEQLDWTGEWVNLPRKVGEIDENYRYRLKHGTKSNEASNTTAIQNALLDMQYSSNVDYEPFTHGSGTGTCYIIPNDYDETTIMKALKEVSDTVKKVASPSLYVEYIIPTVRSVKFQIIISAPGTDLDVVKSNITTAISAYVDAIAPKEYLSVGAINRIGLAESGVESFSVASVLIDNVPQQSSRILQGLDTKMLFDEILWVEDNSEA